jgi:CheY-like chemotaxis protein
MPPKRIIVINDTQEILELFYQILHEEEGYDVTLCSFQPQMIDKIREAKPDLIVTDFVFGEEKIGWQFIQRLKMDRETATIPVVICSGAIKELKEIEGYLASKNIGVVYKPFDIDDLLVEVARKIEPSPVLEGDKSRSARNAQDSKS